MNFIKPHLKMKAVLIMANDLDASRPGAISEHLRKLSAGTSFGNLDADDLKPPQLKLLAGQSPEVLDGVPNALPGNFWVTVLNQNLGQSAVGSPIMLRKTYQVWAPRGSGSESKGPLAVASDGINWDIPNLSFEVKFPGNRTYTWKLGRTVAETGAQKFGSSQDDDPSSKPIATKTFDVLWLIDLPNKMKQLVVFRSSRTGQKPTENMANAAETKRIMTGVASFMQRWQIVVKKPTGPTGDIYFAYDYRFLEEVREEDAQSMRDLYDRYRASGFVSEPDEHGDSMPHQPAAGGPVDEIPFMYPWR